eukprot:TRINITY_DN66878_c0_g1_i1.p1 TRINITY_DN66878_c0_g1~~TRINITY_DN66878_c0_g1_i1.p1  ORF type:complete len:101 (-),score=1.40 TRINITY_DN66878_c0_g1_i1:50-319(-)
MDRPDVQALLAQEQERLNFQTQMAKMTMQCFPKCVKDFEVTQFSSSERKCLELCPGRLLDARNIIAERLAGRRAPRERERDTSSDKYDY